MKKCRLLFKRFKQLVEGGIGIALVFVEQRDELRTDDGTCSIVLCSLEGLCIADAKTNHTGIAQVHGVDASEIVLFLFVETLLNACDGSGADHIDETVGVVVDEADALLAGLWGDEHDDAQVVAVGNGFYDVLIVGEGQVRDDDTADSTFHALLTECLDAEMQDGVEITHEDQRYLYLILDGLQLVEKELHAHTVFQCLCGSTLDDRTVGEWVAEGDTHFNHGNTATLHRENNIGSAIEGGTAGTEIKGQEFFVASVGEELVDFVHCCFLMGVMGMDGNYGVRRVRKRRSASTSLMAGAVSKREFRSMPMHLG